MGPSLWNAKGEMVRPPTELRSFISREPGAKFPPEKGRYHLYVSYACPWGKYSSTYCQLAFVMTIHLPFRKICPAEDLPYLHLD